MKSERRSADPIPSLSQFDAVDCTYGKRQVTQGAWWVSVRQRITSEFPGPPRLISDRELGDRVESILGDYLMQELSKGWTPASLLWGGFYPISVLGPEGARQVHF